MSRLAGKVAIVTGGAQGIGEEIATRLVADGAKVAIADLNGDKAKVVAERLTRDGGAAIGVAVDVAICAEVRAAVEATVAAFGRLDIVFNNAGFNKPLPFDGSRRGQFQRDHARQRLGRAALHPGGGEADDGARARAAKSSTPPPSRVARAMRNSRPIVRARPR